MTQFPLVSFTFPYFDNIQIKEKNNTYYLLVLHFASFPAHQHNHPTPSPWRQNITVNKIACKTSLEKVTHCLVIFNWKVYLTCFHQETLDTDYYQGRCLIIYIKLLLLYSKNLFSFTTINTFQFTLTLLKFRVEQYFTSPSTEISTRGFVRFKAL